MAALCQRSRKLLQLVQQRLFAVGSNAPSPSTHVQQLTALQSPEWTASCGLRGFRSHVGSQTGRQIGQVLPASTRSFCTASTTSARPRGPVSWQSLALTAATGGGLMLYYNHLMSKKLQTSGLPREAAAGKPMLGGPFELTDQDGKPFSNKDLLGKWALLYFGFTFCPDICPDELEKMAEAIDAVEKESGAQVQPVFITLDPARDNTKQVKQYVQEFHPRLIGLTGPEDKVNAAAKAYRVYHMKTDETDDYLVDHSIIMYLVNPEGEFVTFFGKNFDGPALAKAMQGHMQSARAEHKPAAA